MAVMVIGGGGQVVVIVVGGQVIVGLGDRVVVAQVVLEDHLAKVGSLVTIAQEGEMATVAKPVAKCRVEGWGGH
jgi:hypothetical protein